MLDSFAKRLNSQLVPSPGDIDDADRWAVGGHVRPTPWAAGAIVATLGALTGAFVGTNDSPEASNFEFADRVRTQLIPYPGDLELLQNRYAIAGHFLFVGEDSDNVAGAIEAVLGGLQPSFLGEFDAPPSRDGAIGSTLGGLTTAFVGTSFYRLFFDIEWSLTPTIEFVELPSRDGALGVTLGELGTSILGTALPPDSVFGDIATTLGALSTSFAGSFTAPGSFDGLIHGNLSGLVPSFVGTSVPADSSVGAVTATLGGLTSELIGTSATSVSDGLFGLSLGALDASFYGQFIEAGAIVGLIDGEFGALTASFRGALVNPDPLDRPDSIRVEPAFEATIAVEAHFEADLVKATPTV